MPKSSATPSPDLVRLRDYHRALGAFSRVAAEILPADRLLHYVTAQVSSVTHIRHVKVMRYRPERADLLVEAGVGWKPGVVGVATFAIDGASPPGRSLQTAAPVVIEDLPNDPEYRTSPVLRDHDIVSLLNVPVRIDGRVWGVLEVDSATPRGFDDGDVTFLSAMANMLGVALLRVEAERRVEEAAAEHARERSFTDIVMREYQHRVKNNLQVIISLMALQRRHATSPEVKERLARVMERVHAIALAQDQLSFTAAIGGNVEFGDYLRALCANLSPAHEGVLIEVDVEQGAMLPLDRAVAAGLIVNELVTNALKYAFGDGSGTIRVTFRTEPDLSEGVLAVEDDGRGMGAPREGGLGLTLVAALASQLDGQVETDPAAKGTRTSVRFPLPL